MIYFKTPSRLECLQSLWLLACLSMVFGIGAYNWRTASRNETSQWKPEKKRWSIDYGAGYSELYYQIPYINVKLNYRFKDDALSTCDDPQFRVWLVYDDIQDLLEHEYSYSYSEFIDYSRYREESLDVWKENAVAIEEAGRCKIFFNIIFNDTFTGTAVPDPSLGSFAFHILFEGEDWDLVNYDTTIQLEFVRTLEHYELWDWGERNPHPLWIHNDMCVFFMHYSETVLHSYDGSVKSDFTTTFSYESDNTELNYYQQVLVAIDVDSEVEHWEEYVDYGYLDWFVGMGGMVSFSITIFFFVADKLRKVIGETSTGILAKIGMLYRHEETLIRWASQRQSSSKSNINTGSILNPNISQYTDIESEGSSPHSSLKKGDHTSTLASIENESSALDSIRVKSDVFPL